MTSLSSIGSGSGSILCLATGITGITGRALRAGCSGSISGSSEETGGNTGGAPILGGAAICISLEGSGLWEELLSNRLCYLFVCLFVCFFHCLLVCWFVCLFVGCWLLVCWLVGCWFVGLLAS